MKPRDFISTFTLMLCLFSCEPPATFTEPQPTGSVDLSKIPNKLQGEYLSLSDSSVLLINESVIQRNIDYEVKTHLNQLGDNEQLLDDTLFNLTTHDKHPVKISGDSLVVSFHFIDTLFHISKQNVLRKFKGVYFLNLLYDKKSWEVRKMQLSKGELTVSNIKGQDDIKRLKEVAESIKDTVPPYEFTITRKQFRKFIKKEGFSQHETFVLQKKK
ncbi:MAG: hypothetical protein RBS07_09655 [Lentimicrobium sp.]|nr:hypothetical protein [Lentimicrobium sp.]